MAEQVSEQAVFDFLEEHIRSVWTLELLLLLRENPTQTWSPADLILKQRSSQKIVEVALKSLADANIVSLKDDKYYFAPATENLEKIIEQICSMYVSRPTTMMRLFASAAADEKLRLFSDAFKFKG